MNGLSLMPEYRQLGKVVGADAFRPDHGHRHVLKAHEAYERTRRRGRWHRLWARLRGRRARLWSLKQVAPAGTVRIGKTGGVRLVPLDRIQGSEGKANAFDLDFYPRQDRTRDRWVGVALARAAGQSLPPVNLVLVDDGCRPLYFVRDGHHRISVARAYGQTEIEAEVSNWYLRRRAPWSNDVAPESSCRAARQPSYAGVLAAAD